MSELTPSGDPTAAPGTHVVSFVGATDAEVACDNNGSVLNDLIHQREPSVLRGGLVANCNFSHKPNPTYLDYYEKMSTYADTLGAYAQAIDPHITAKMSAPIATAGDESVFRYLTRSPAAPASAP